MSVCRLTRRLTRKGLDEDAVNRDTSGMAKAVLVELEHKQGVAAVIRDDDGEVWLTNDVGSDFATGILDQRPEIQVLEGELTLQGGLLPQGAVGAEVVDDAGRRQKASAANGAWLVLLAQASREPAPVRYFDSTGESVAPVLPEEWPRSPVADAGEECPACGAHGWDEVKAVDDSHGMVGTNGGEEPQPFLVCRACGHEVEMGTFLRLEAAEGLDPDEVERRRQAFEERRRREAREALANASFPIYAAVGWSVEVSGWGGGMRPEDIHSIRLSHGEWREESGPELHVETELEERAFESDLTLAREALESSLFKTTGSWPNLSEAALTSWLDTQKREHRRLAAEAEPQSRPIDVDDRPQEFVVLEAGPRWVAVARRHAAVITLSATDVAPETVQLQTVRDPLSLAG